MSHRVVSEHRHLEALFEGLDRALADGRASERAWELFEQLSEEMHTHFEREDRLYFPAIWGLRPELKPPLEELVCRHEWFRNQLRRISDHVGHGDVAGAVQLLHSVQESFWIHEQIEEQLLARLDAEIEAGPGS